jgi:hypothetical protein
MTKSKNWMDYAEQAFGAPTAGPTTAAPATPAPSGKADAAIGAGVIGAAAGGWGLRRFLKNRANPPTGYAKSGGLLDAFRNTRYIDPMKARAGDFVEYAGNEAKLYRGPGSLVRAPGAAAGLAALYAGAEATRTGRNAIRDVTRGSQYGADADAGRQQAAAGITGYLSDKLPRVNIGEDSPVNKVLSYGADMGQLMTGPAGMPNPASLMGFSPLDDAYAQKAQKERLLPWMEGQDPDTLAKAMGFKNAAEARKGGKHSLGDIQKAYDKLEGAKGAGIDKSFLRTVKTDLRRQLSEFGVPANDLMPDFDAVSEIIAGDKKLSREDKEKLIREMADDTRYESIANAKAQYRDQLAADARQQGIVDAYGQYGQANADQAINAAMAQAALLNSYAADAAAQGDNYKAQIYQLMGTNVVNSAQFAAAQDTARVSQIPFRNAHDAQIKAFTKQYQQYTNAANRQQSSGGGGGDWAAGLDADLADAGLDPQAMGGQSNLMSGDMNMIDPSQMPSPTGQGTLEDWLYENSMMGQ